IPCAVIHDRNTGQVLAIAEPDSAAWLDQIAADAHDVAHESDEPGRRDLAATILEEAPDAFLERVRRAQEYIRAGDIYQANLSRPWRISLGQDAEIADLYARLCAANPAPFAALVQWRDVALLSSSPERLVSLSDGLVQTRPIAGTRPRSRRPGDD